MSREQQHIRRMGQRAPEQDGVKQGDGKYTSWTKADMTSWDPKPAKGTAAQRGMLNLNGKNQRNDAGNNRKGHQDRNPEIRGACSYMEPRKNGSDKYPAIGTISLSNANDYEIELTADTQLQFDYTGFDTMEGSDRGNILVSRALYAMLKIVHNGFKVTFPAGSYWSEGAIPDVFANPTKPVTTGTGSTAKTTRPRHLVTMYVTRVGVIGDGTEPVTEVHFGLYGPNMAAVG